MPDFDPDAFLASTPVPATGGGFDPDAFLRGDNAPSEGVGTSLKRAVTDIPHEIYQAGAAGLHEMNAVNPWGQERTEARARGEMPGMFAVPRAALGTLALAGSPITGTARSVGGHLLDLLNRGMRAGAVQLYGEDKVRKAEADLGHPVGGGGYEGAKADVDQMMMGLGPKGGMRPPAVPPPVPPRAGPLGVTLSEGQETGALPAIQREQSALAGRLGPSAMDTAKQFETQQQGQVQAAHEGVRQSLDPFGQVIADTPHEAGQIVSEGVQQTAAARKADVDAAYQHVRSLPGEVHADAFKDIGARIKDDLSNRPEPIVIDDGLTPFASKAIQDVDNRIGQLQIQNRASATGQPPQNSIMGVTLNGVDQMRKRLSAFRNQAFGSGNATDGRAVKAVINAFDDHIDNAINSGLFTGDQRAVQAWNNARAAYADYAGTFKAGPSDPVGRVVEKIVGKYTNDPMIPNKVADQLYGAQGTSASDLNVGVANRVKKILGEQSPEWSAVKQGLFSRLTETAEGVTDWGSQKVSNNLSNFLNGKGRDLAEAVFSPQERQLLRQYADLHKQLVVPPKGMNPSQTSTFIAPLLRRIGSKIGMVVGTAAGAVLGHSSGIPFGIEAGAAAGAGMAKAINAVANAREAAQVSRQMPLIAQTTQRYQKALAAVQNANSPPSQRALAVATVNLAKSLQPLGIDFGKLNTVQGPAPASAEQNQRQRGGRTNAQPDQGEQRKAHMADGGDIEGRNAPFVRPIPSTYNTDLGGMEPMFRAWVAKNKVPFNPDSPPSDYDMRGFYQALVNGDERARNAVDPNDGRLHFPDTWKTPQHETFSNQSQWATPDAPQWNERDQLVAPSGRILFDDRQQGDAPPRFARGGRVNPANIDHNPTEAQKRSGNYAKDHIRIHGLDITIENAKGSKRSGTGRDGKPWSVRMPAHYGYVKRTEGADGDHVDVYLGPHLKSPHVFVVDQRDADSRAFDEHKVLLGFGSATQARHAYLKAFSDGRGHERLGHMAAMTVDEFKHWLARGDTAKPIRAHRPAA